MIFPIYHTMYYVDRAIDKSFAFGECCWLGWMEEKWKWRERRRNWRRHTIMRHKQQTYSTFLRKRSDHNWFQVEENRQSRRSARSWPRPRKCLNKSQKPIMMKHLPSSTRIVSDRSISITQTEETKSSSSQGLLPLPGLGCMPTIQHNQAFNHHEMSVRISPPLTLCRCRRKVFEKFRLWKLQFRWCMNFHLSDHSTG